MSTSQPPDTRITAARDFRQALRYRTELTSMRFMAHSVLVDLLSGAVRHLDELLAYVDETTQEEQP